MRNKHEILIALEMAISGREFYESIYKEYNETIISTWLSIKEELLFQWNAYNNLYLNYDHKILRQEVVLETIAFERA